MAENRSDKMLFLAATALMCGGLLFASQTLPAGLALGGAGPARDITATPPAEARCPGEIGRAADKAETDRRCPSGAALSRVRITRAGLATLRY